MTHNFSSAWVQTGRGCHVDHKQIGTMEDSGDTPESQHWSQQAEGPGTLCRAHASPMDAGWGFPAPWIFGSLFHTPKSMGLEVLSSPHNFCYLMSQLMLTKSYLYSGGTCCLTVKQTQIQSLYSFLYLKTKLQQVSYKFGSYCWRFGGHRVAGKEFIEK